MLRVQDATLRLGDERSKKTILSASKDFCLAANPISSCAHRTRPLQRCISSYCVVLWFFAFASSKKYIMLTPSIGFCAIPLTMPDAVTCAASRIVGTMTW